MWQLGRYDGSRWVYITRQSKRALLKTHQRQACTHLDDFPSRFMLHVSHSLLFCCSLNRQNPPLPSGVGISWPVIPLVFAGFFTCIPILCLWAIPLGPVMKAGPSARSAWFIIYLYCSPHLQSSPLRHGLKMKLQPQSCHWLMRLTHIASERGVERVRTFLAQDGVSFLCLSDFSWVSF